MDYDLNPQETCLLHDAARVAHVPGVLVRRAQWLGQARTAMKLMDRYRVRHMLEKPPLDVHSPYDYLTFVADPANAHQRDITWELYLLQRRIAKQYGLTDVQDFGDAFITAAALGDLTLLMDTITTKEPSQVGVPMGIAVGIAELVQILQVACVNGHWGVAKWVCGPTTWTTLVPQAAPTTLDDHDISAHLQRGVHCAMTTMATTTMRDSETMAALREVMEMLGMDGTTVDTEVSAAQEESVACQVALQMESVSIAEREEENEIENKNKNDDYASGLAFAVLTDASLMAAIGYYQEEPLADVKRFKRQSKLFHGFAVGWTERATGSLPRVAIIEGNLAALRSIYNAARRLRAPLPRPEYSFQRAMHIAACEGQLAILKWLHALPGDTHKCRPDTMAMAVRCGWPEVVEWLHWNCPDSAQTMSAHCVNDAASWGHVGVLRICHKYELGKISSAAMARAARFGQLQVVKYLCWIRGDLSTSSAMDNAIQLGHLEMVEWLHANCGEAIDSDQRIVLALTSTAATADKLLQFSWSKVDAKGQLVVDCAVSNFVQMCTTGMAKAVSFFLPLVLAHDKSLGDDLLQQGFRGATTSGHIAIVKQLFTHDVTLGDPQTLGEAIRLAVQKKDMVFVHLLAKTGRIATCDLADVCRMVLALDDRTMYEMIQPLLDLDIDLHCMDALPLLAAGTWEDDAVRARYDTMKRIYPRRTQVTAVQALRAVTHANALKFLLEAEDKFYTERILLENAPATLLPQLVRFLIHHGRAKNKDAVACFGGIIQERNDMLTLKEVELLATKCKDQEINALVATHREMLLPMTLWIDAAHGGKTTVIEYLCREVSVPLYEKEAIDVACTNTNEQHLEMLKILLAKSSRAMTARTIETTFMAIAQRATIVQLLLNRPNDHDQIDQIDHVLGHGLSKAATLQTRSENGSINTLQPTSTPVLPPLTDEDAPNQRGWAMDLLRMVIQTPCQRHRRQKLLETVAKTGHVEAMELVMGSIDTDTNATQLDIVMVPAMVQAAHGGHREIIQLLYTSKRPEETMDVGKLRQSFGISDTKPMAMLLSLLEAWDPCVRGQLEQERSAASSLFGFSSTASASSTNTSSNNSKRGNARAKRGGRRA